MDTLNRELIETTLSRTSRFFLILHLILLILFFFCDLYLMMLVSLICMGLCAASSVPLRRDDLRAHVALLFAAVLLETLSAVWFVGWGGGFQLALLLLVMLAFCGEYIGRTLKLPHLPAVPLAVSAAVVYLLLLFFAGRTPSFTDAGALTRFQAFWGAVVFGYIGMCLYALVRLTTHSEKVLTDKASVDKLTGLYNRAGYDRILAEMDLNSTILLLFDTDKFKAVNDTYGHETGDRVLVSISRAIRQNFRSEDRVCRIGGDEFVVLMLNVEGDQRDLIRRKVNRINRELAHPEGKLPIVSLSVGVAFGADEPDAETLFAHADEALYKVKQAGGRDCIFYGD